MHSVVHYFVENLNNVNLEKLIVWRRPDNDFESNKCLEESCLKFATQSCLTFQTC